MCRAPVMTTVAETVYAIDITMSAWVRASRLVFGKDEQLKKLRNRELCGGGQAEWGRPEAEWCWAELSVWRRPGTSQTCA